MSRCLVGLVVLVVLLDGFVVVGLQKKKHNHYCMLRRDTAPCRVWANRRRTIRAGVGSTRRVPIETQSVSNDRGWSTHSIVVTDVDHHVIHPRISSLSLVRPWRASFCRLDRLRQPQRRKWSDDSDTRPNDDSTSPRPARGRRSLAPLAIGGKKHIEKRKNNRRLS
jgi:hypothetical protein